MAKNFIKKLDALHWHEALDRSAICMEMVDRLILFHPAIESTKTLKAKAEEAHQLLFESIRKSAACVWTKQITINTCFIQP